MINETRRSANIAFAQNQLAIIEEDPPGQERAKKLALWGRILGEFNSALTDKDMGAAKLLAFKGQ